MPADFGVFAPVFISAHGYLALLGLRSADARGSVEVIRECCESVDDPSPDICRLLENANWRPHLVASVAVIVQGYQEATCQMLWGQFDAGSWVTPQIGVALSLVDPNFLGQARKRLEAGCPLDLSVLKKMGDVERHSAAGPAGSTARSAKAAGALLRLVQMKSPIPNWLNTLAVSDDFQTLIGADTDASDRITEGWHMRIHELVSGENDETIKG